MAVPQAVSAPVELNIVSARRLTLDEGKKCQATIEGVISADDEPKMSTNNKLYFFGQLRDRSTAVSLKIAFFSGDVRGIWEAITARSRDSAAVVKVSGRLEAGTNLRTGTKEAVLWCDMLSFSARDPGEFMVPPFIPVERSWAYIQECAASLRGTLKVLTQAMLDEYGDKYRLWAAATMMHQPTAGGLAEHVHNMLRIVEFDTQFYLKTAPEAVPGTVDLRRYEDLLKAGVIWHDMGKIFTYNPPPGNGRLPDEKLFTHSLVGVMKLTEFCARLGIDPLKDADIRSLIHMIASHHGQKDWGALVDPLTPEAHALHNIDRYEASRSHSALTGREGRVADDEIMLGDVLATSSAPSTPGGAMFDAKSWGEE